MKIRVGLISLIALAILLTPGSAFAAGATAVGAQDYLICAVTSLGGVECWGLNDDGQLGDGTTTSSITLVAVSGLATGVVAVGLGEVHACALTSGGGVNYWGGGGSGELGDGTKINSSSPLTVVWFAGFSADLSIARTAAASVDAGANLTYTLTVSNAGPDTASNVSVTDVLPGNVTFVSVGPGSAIGAWGLGALALAFDAFVFFARRRRAAATG
jgi:uncharacterized repeat protein (TIGR01451 family)